MNFPTQLCRTPRDRKIKRAGSFWQHWPIEVVRVSDSHDAVLDGQTVERVRRSRFPRKRFNLARNYIDQHRMLDAGVFEAEGCVQRWECVARIAVGCQPVCND